MKPWVVWMLVTIVLWGIAAFLRKPASQHLAPGSALTAEIIGGILAVLVVGLFFREQVISTSLPGMLYGVLAGFFAVGGAFFLYRALKVGPVSIITPLGALSAVLTVILGFLVLHERISLAQGAGIVLAILAAALLGL